MNPLRLFVSTSTTFVFPDGKRVTVTKLSPFRCLLARIFG